MIKKVKESIDNPAGVECWTLRIGIFFDGSGKNGNAWAGTPNELFNVTNIYRLYQLYQACLNEKMMMITSKFYIEGIGTLHNKPDDYYSTVTGDEGLFGNEGYGPDSKLKKCIDNVQMKLTDMIMQGGLDGKKIKIEFDVFGFSRGAVLARHFVNVMFKKDSDHVRKIQAVLSKHRSESVGNPAVNFLGLFDTVGTFMDKSVFTNDPHDTGYTRNLKVKVPPGATRHAFQLNAYHECRYNYPLHSLSGIYPELTIAGSHADVGGGSPHMMHEHVDVSDRHWRPWHTAQFWVERELL